ncbi:c-type cytochrome [Bernardetia sp.]|uniref:c-type cytochrome n=1 Tax=Bernardetia sp. TaxID=1937974 RepID=UPI0025BB98F3|nr:cytochrome c [Bernardetia sp.]
MLNAIPTAAYTGLSHTHKLVVLLFVVLYVVKLALLLFSEEKLDKMRENKPAKIFEMVLSFLFLGTGIAMWTAVADPFNTLFLIKIVAVFASIPLAVIGFKKKNKVLAILSVVLLFAAYGLAEVKKASYKKPETQDVVYNTTETSVYGKQLYEQYCQNCHGADGAAGLSGAKNLQTSTLSDEETKKQIVEGKGNMPAYEKVLNEKEIDAVVTHVKSLRK